LNVYFKMQTPSWRIASKLSDPQLKRIDQVGFKSEARRIERRSHLAHHDSERNIPARTISFHQRSKLIDKDRMSLNWATNCRGFVMPWWFLKIWGRKFCLGVQENVFGPANAIKKSSSLREYFRRQERKLVSRNLLIKRMRELTGNREDKKINDEWYADKNEPKTWSGFLCFHDMNP